MNACNMQGGIRVLYVDDEPGLLEIGKIFLEKSEGLQVDTSTSAQDALTTSPIQACEAIVSDYQMPEMNGIAFLKHVRARFGDIPFILFTGKGREEVVIEAINNGADFYLQKGGDPKSQFAELAHKIRQAVARKKAELARQESEDKFRSLIELTPLGVMVQDMDRKILYVNPEGLRLAGAKSVEDFLGKDAFTYIHPDDRAKVLAQASLRKSETASPPFELRLLTLDGRPYTVEVTSKPILYGGVPAMMILFQDLTARKKAEDELHAAYEQIAASEEELRANLDEIIRGQQEREKSERNFQNLVDTIPDALYIQVNDRFVYLNKAALRLFGAASPEELLGINPWDRIHPDFHEIVRNRVRSVTAEQQNPGTLDEVFLRLDGTPVDVSVTGVPYMHEGEYGVLVMLHDISERKRSERDLRAAYEQITASEEELRQQYEELASAQQKLRESQDQFVDFAGTVPGVVYQFYARPDGTLGFYFVSSRAPEVFGIGADPAHFFEEFNAHTDPRDKDAILRSIREAVSSGSPWDIEGRFIKPSGETIWFHGFSRPVKRSTEILYNGVLVDITARKLAEEALRVSEEKYRHILENMQDAYVRTDENGVIVMASPSAARLHGYGSEEEMVGLRPVSLYHRAEQFGEAFRILQEKGSVTDFIAEGARKDGSTFWLSVNLQYIHDAEGRPRGCEAIVRDISERRSMEHAIKEANRKLNLLNSITRHDIVNQLTIVQGFAQLAAGKERDPEISQSLSRIHAASETIRRQIEFMKAYQDLGVHSPAWFPLDKVVGTAGRKEVSCSPSCTGFEIYADPMLEKVFFNLFDNALRHGEHVTKIVVSCEEGPGGLAIVVEDDGIGVPDRNKEKIFEKGVGKNTGFGLFLTREILAITGITIRETGTPGKGARIEIAVPKGMYRIAGK